MSTSIPALYQLSAQSIYNHSPLFWKVAWTRYWDGWFCLPDSEKNEMVPTLLKYEAVCVSHMYIWSSQRKNKKNCKFCYKKKSSKVFLIDSLIEIVHVTSVWWSVSCHVRKQEGHSHPWCQPSKCEGPQKREQWDVGRGDVKMKDAGPR